MAGYSVRKKPGPIRFKHKGQTYSIPLELEMTAKEWFELLDKEGDELAQYRARPRETDSGFEALEIREG